MKVVFDTNILISARLSMLGNPFKCLALAKVGVFESVTCREIIEEFEEKLRTKFDYPVGEARRSAEEIEKISHQVLLTRTLKVIEADPEDDMVLECAVIGGADYVVSGDRHLLDFGKFRNIEIIRAADFLTRIT